jgi:hypothetical protein
MVLALAMLRWRIRHTEVSMIRSTAALIAVLSIGGVSRGYAQENSPGPGTVEVTVIPGGATFFTSRNDAASFGNYTLGGALTYNVNRIVGVEGEVGSSTGGGGGLTVFKQASLGINSDDTFLTGNVGGGVKWYAPNGRRGLRGDYRFMGTQSKDDAPAFFGQDTRYGHRVYGALIINAVR